MPPVRAGASLPAGGGHVASAQSYSTQAVAAMHAQLEAEGSSTAHRQAAAAQLLVQPGAVALLVGCACDSSEHSSQVQALHVLRWLLECEGSSSSSSKARHPVVLAAAAACLEGVGSSSTAGCEECGPGSSAAVTALQLLAQWADSEAGAAQVCEQRGLLAALARCLDQADASLVVAAAACLRALVGQELQAAALVEQPGLLDALVGCLQREDSTVVAAAARTLSVTGIAAEGAAAVYAAPGALEALQACLKPAQPLPVVQCALAALVNLSRVNELDLVARPGFLDAVADCITFETAVCAAVIVQAARLLANLCLDSKAAGAVLEHRSFPSLAQSLVLCLTSPAAAGLPQYSAVRTLRFIARANAAALCAVPGALDGLAAALYCDFERTWADGTKDAVASNAAWAFKALAAAPAARDALLEQQPTILAGLTAALGHSTNSAVEPAARAALQAWGGMDAAAQQAVWDALAQLARERQQLGALADMERNLQQAVLGLARGAVPAAAAQCGECGGRGNGGASGAGGGRYGGMRVRLPQRLLRCGWRARHVVLICAHAALAAVVVAHKR